VDEDVGFTWSILEFDEESLTIKLTFKHSAKVSSNEGNPNILKVKVIEPSFFVREEDSRQVQTNSTIQIILPQQK